jgi:hypothetical protein
MTSLAPPAKAVPQGQGITSAILILSDLVPLAGILFWGWDTFILLCLYCLETAVIGFWTIARAATMSAIPDPRRAEASQHRLRSRDSSPCMPDCSCPCTCCSSIRCSPGHGVDAFTMRGSSSA